MGSLFLQHFDYVEWLNYLYKVIEHVQQLIKDPNGPGSVGAISSEGNEAVNKLFRKKISHILKTRMGVRVMF